MGTRLRVLGAGTFARVPSEGLALAIVLAQTDVAFAGMLIGAATFPQMITGPIGGHLLDRSQRPDQLIALAAIATAAAFVLLTADPWAIQFVAALAIAATAPILTGGLSATFTAWVAAGDTHVVSAWDGVAYNIAGVISPVVVTAIAVAASPNWSLVALAATGVVTAGFVIGAPGRDARPTDPEPDQGVAILRALRTMWRERGVRAVTVATTIDHVGVGALTIALASAAVDHGHPATAAGVVASVRAVSALAGSL
ncbi:MAG TPA: MFS transporter, partial [Ilumatobacter sp.]|nr:MFS transporter [Ilumatobacter sp.]